VAILTVPLFDRHWGRLALNPVDAMHFYVNREADRERATAVEKLRTFGLGAVRYFAHRDGAGNIIGHDNGEARVIGLNYFLRKAGIDLGRARLVRHQDTRAAPGRSPHDLWMAADGRFEMYQRIQAKERFRSADWVIAFVATPLDETLFVGIYRVRGVGTAPPGFNPPNLTICSY
jgi:hypothetical protein